MIVSICVGIDKRLHKHTCFHGSYMSKHLTPKVTTDHYAITLCSAFGQAIEVKYSLLLHNSWYDLIRLLKGCDLTGISWCHESITLVQTTSNFEKSLNQLYSNILMHSRCQLPVYTIHLAISFILTHCNLSENY